MDSGISFAITLADKKDRERKKMKFKLMIVLMPVFTTFFIIQSLYGMSPKVDSVVIDSSMYNVIWSIKKQNVNLDRKVSFDNHGTAFIRVQENDFSLIQVFPVDGGKRAKVVVLTQPEGGLFAGLFRLVSPSQKGEEFNSSLESYIFKKGLLNISG